MTADVYTHTIPQQRREAIERLENRIIGPKRTQVSQGVGNGGSLVN